MPELVLGPLLRYAGETDATVWVETDAACEVEVLGCRSRTFRVVGYHYALAPAPPRAPRGAVRGAAARGVGGCGSPRAPLPPRWLPLRPGTRPGARAGRCV